MPCFPGEFLTTISSNSEATMKPTPPQIDSVLLKLYFPPQVFVVWLLFVADQNHGIPKFPDRRSSSSVHSDVDPH
ncbi:hypothetical protein COP1_032878 [Malus domestica]